MEKEERMEDIIFHPDYPVVEGNHQITEDWFVFLPGKFSRRIEDGSLVLWRSGFTIWMNVWNNAKNETAKERRDDVVKRASKDRYNEEFIDRDFLYYSYRLAEDEGDNRMAAFYCFAFGIAGEVQMAIYFDKEEDLKWAKQIWQSLKEIPQPMR